MIGPGKYDLQLTEALKSAQAKTGFLIVIDGNQGAGFACQMEFGAGRKLLRILKYMTDEIEKDISRLEDEL